MVSLGNRNDAKKWDQQEFYSTYVLSSAEDPNCEDVSTSDPISFPNSNAFIDLNGDCLPEIVLTRQAGTPETLGSKSDVKTYYQIFSQVFDANGSSKYCLAHQDG